MNQILEGDSLSVLRSLPDGCVNTCVTSPPYWGLRDYGVEGQFGLEPTPEEYVQSMVEICREIKRVLRDDGTFWLNLGDTHASYKDGKYPPQTISNGNQRSMPVSGAANRTKAAYLKNGIQDKEIIGIPWMVAFALRADGWRIRKDIIWNKPNPTPEKVKDRPTTAHEYLFLLTKKKNYFYDADAIAEPTDDGGTRNKRTVWTVQTSRYKGAHFATFPPDLIEPCVLAGCPEGGVVLDPFFGSGTTGEVSVKNNRSFIGIELNPDYIELARKRIGGHIK